MLAIWQMVLFVLIGYAVGAYHGLSKNLRNVKLRPAEYLPPGAPPESECALSYCPHPRECQEHRCLNRKYGTRQ